MHVVYYDGECAMCNRAVHFLTQRDKRGVFTYRPLKEESDTLIFLENAGTSKEQKLRYGKGALRILWHLGGVWRLPGLLSFLPGWLAEPVYRAIARRRHLF